MGIISWLILGLIAGFIGSKIVDSEWPGLVARYRLGHRGCHRRRSSVQRGWYARGNRIQHLEHDRCRHWLCRSALGLSCADGPSVMRFPRVSRFVC